MYNEDENYNNYNQEEQYSYIDASYRNVSHIPEEPEKKPRRKSGMAGRVAGITAAALLFGVVSGGTMVGVNWIADGIQQQNSPENAPPVTVATSQSNENSDLPRAAQVTTTLNTDVSEIVEKAMPSVVAINNTVLYESNTFFGSQTYEVPSSGSGIILGQNDKELLIVTNNHVVSDSEELKVSFIDDSSVSAAIKGTDAESDLAVIAVNLSDIPEETLSKISIATLGDSDDLKVGQGVIAIGNALGYGQSVTVGYVSAMNREVSTGRETTRNLLQTDAAINPGNSGGALLNMKGEVIGINAAKYSSTEVEGMGYAIPISKATDIINELMNKRTKTVVEEASQGYLGIQGSNIDQATADSLGMPRGVLIFKILENGAASQSDLKEKDIITKFDGETIRTMEDLQKTLTYYEAGQTVDLTVQSLENGVYNERTVSVTLGQRPASKIQNQ